MGPLITAEVHEALLAALRAGTPVIECSLDLGRSRTSVEVGSAGWRWQGRTFPYLASCKERTVYHWCDEAFRPVARYTGALVKLVPTPWGPPTFEIDGIKMLPSAQRSPYEDARSKVQLIQPRGKMVLDTCGGLGYFAAWCLHDGAAHVLSYEKSADVIWLRSVNPWSPSADCELPSRAPPDPRQGALCLVHADVASGISSLEDASFDAVLHDPPRFGIAGELYSQAFYDGLARVLKRAGRMFHYTGAPNRLARGRDLPQEVAARLRRAGFSTRLQGDGVYAVKRG